MVSFITLNGRSIVVFSGTLPAGLTAVSREEMGRGGYFLKIRRPDRDLVRMIE